MVAQIVSESDVCIQEKPKDARLKNLEGQQFGRIIVIGYAGRKHSRASWYCRCECGNITVVMTTSLMSGNTTSCGCYHRHALSERKTTHGATRKGHEKPEYRVWMGMIKRCSNPRDKRFSDYGGRGIQVKFASFEEFFAEVGPRPSAKHTIDRINNDGHYESGNVRWATYVEQNNNRRTSRFIEINDERLTVAQWARKLNIKREIIKDRLMRGWSETEAVLGKNTKHS